MQVLPWHGTENQNQEDKGRAAAHKWFCKRYDDIL